MLKISMLISVSDTDYATLTQGVQSELKLDRTPSRAEVTAYVTKKLEAMIVGFAANIPATPTKSHVARPSSPGAKS